jgi:hypothetical protein
MEIAKEKEQETEYYIMNNSVTFFGKEKVNFITYYFEHYTK